MKEPGEIDFDKGGIISSLRLPAGIVMTEDLEEELRQIMARMRWECCEAIQCSLANLPLLPSVHPHFPAPTEPENPCPAE